MRGRDPSTITLDEALAYQNDLIPLRFIDDWDVSLDEARLLFDDLKRWLWLNAQTGWELVFVGPVTILDEMFHTFILFTEDYRKYCDQVYGMYVDHYPFTIADREQLAAESAKDHEGTRQRELEFRDRQRRHIAERLGVDILIRWWVDYPTKYGDEFFATRRKAYKPQWKPDAALIALAAEMREP